MTDDEPRAEPMDHVQAIVEATERSRSEIGRRAQEAAEVVRAGAAEDARATVEHANAEADEQVAHAAQAGAALRERLAVIEAEVDGLVQALRAETERLGDGLSGLASDVEELAVAAGPAEEERSNEAVEAGGEAGGAGAGNAARGRPAGDRAGARGARTDQVEGARLIALDMAAGGAPREETDRYLLENFDLRDRQELLTQVYGPAGD